MPRLSREERLIALGMIQANRSYSEVARHFGCTRRTISNLVERNAETGSVDDRPRPGRERVTTPEQDRYINLLHLRNRFRSASRTARETPGRNNPRISSSTVRRRLRQRDLRCRRPVRGSILTPIRRRRRLLWTQQRVNWTQRRWNTVLFSDESRFCIDRPDGRERVWRRRGERYANCCIRERDRWGGPSVMVWAGISFHHRTPLVVLEGNLTARRYISDVLEEHAIPFIEQHPNHRIFQHDNARPHSANITSDYLRDQGVSVLPWPAFSPDLSPIEHLWDQLGRRVCERETPPRTRQELINELRVECDRIQQRNIQTLIMSMRRRCQETITARGGHTRY